MVASNASRLYAECPAFNIETADMVVAYLLFLLFPIALLLNITVAWMSLQLPSTSTFTVYIKNVVASDLLMTLTLPLMAADKLPGSTIELKAFTCRYSGVIFYCSMYTGIALMGLISLDRFFKIVRPYGKVLGQNVAFSLVVSTLVWVIIFGSTAIPNMVLTNQDPVNITEISCLSFKNPEGLTLHKGVILFMDTFFWLTGILIVFCYICITVKVLQSFRDSRSNNSQGRRKIKLRVFLIVIVFFVCFMPFHMMRIPFTLYQMIDVKGCREVWVAVLHDLVLWVSTTNVCLDPLLYLYLCREYRDKLADMMKTVRICVGLYSGENKAVSLQK